MITANNSIASIDSERRALRKIMLERRFRVQQEQPEVVERMRCCLRQWLESCNSSLIGFYRPIRGEPDLTEVFEEWASQEDGRGLCVPVVDDLSKKRMHFSAWDGKDIRTGAYGIEEPACDVPVDPEVIFSPCVGVTPEGFRLGNGGGFFDRWLAECRGCGLMPTTVAVAFDCLIIEDFHPMPYDVPMDWILSESGVHPAQRERADAPRRRPVETIASNSAG